MATAAGVGRSIAANANNAGREAAERACASLDGAEPDLCLVFGTSGYDLGGLLAGIRGVTGGARISGCSGEGIIAGPDSDERDRAVGVLAVRSDTLRFDPLLVEGYSDDPAACGREIARRVNAVAGADALGLLVFPDGLHGDCTRLLRSIEAGLVRPIPIVGGAAGDAMAFERTWQFLDERAGHDAVAALLISGGGRLAIEVSHGCQTVGLPREVTAADGGWLREIDGRPAWSVFREFLDGNPEDLDAEGIAHLSLAEELARGDEAAYGDIIIRTPLHLDKPSGALFFPGGGIAAGTMVHIARRDPVRIRERAEACAGRLLADGRGGRPAFVLQFDCAGRGQLLFGPHAAAEIVRPLQRVIGPSVPWIGFHTYGEIAPIMGRSYYHNYTVALCGVFEEVAA